MSELMGCPHCGGAMQITSEFRGRVVRCPHCSKDLTIPAAPVMPTPQAAPTPPVMPPAVPTPAPGAPPHVPSNLVWAILTTLCCCFPFGIVAIVYAAQVSGRLAAGDYAGALSASNNARTWCLVALIVGLACHGFFSFLSFGPWSFGFHPMHFHRHYVF